MLGGSGSPFPQPRCPGRSAGIAPVGGLRAAFWVARDEPGKDHLSHRRRPGSTTWLLWGGSGHSGYFPPRGEPPVIVKVKGNLRAGGSLSHPSSRGPAAVFEGTSLRKRMVSTEGWTKFWPLYHRRGVTIWGPDPGSSPPELCGVMGCSGSRENSFQYAEL